MSLCSLKFKEYGSKPAFYGSNKTGTQVKTGWYQHPRDGPAAGDEPAHDEALVGQVYNNDSLAHDEQRMAELHVHFSRHSEELSRTGVTRQLLWQEYLHQHEDGYSYSRYCYHLQQYHKSRDLSMHLEYNPGDMIMVDFAGKIQYFTDPGTGELIACDVFIAVLPYSGLIF